MIGSKFERWLVLEEAAPRNGHKYWICQCDCGTIREVCGKDLRTGKSKSCGCLRKETSKKRKKDLTGQHFGYLTVCFDTGERKNQKVVWRCLCKCGKECDVVSTQLISGKTQSCGCLQKERTSQTHLKDIKNQTFGKLTAIEIVRYSNSKEVFWKCKCECGNEAIIRSHDLLSGHTSSCGCLLSSKGELKIEAILKENNIKYEKEYSFSNLWLGEGSLKRKARFDFYVNKEYCIEFDGIQHFKSGTGYFDNLDKFQKTQNYDQIKNEYCLNNNIPLIRIPYTHFKELCLEDLLLETSKFIVSKKERD